MEELIFLSESLDAASVAGCHKEWFKTLTASQSDIGMVVDKLNKIDTAGLQLLVAFKKDATLHGRKFSLSGTSEVLRSQSEILGLTSFLFDQSWGETPVVTGSDLRESS